MPLEFGKNLKGMGTLFNAFRKSETRDAALEDVWGRVTEFSKVFAADKLNDGSDLGHLAQSVANSFIVSASSALISGVETDGLSLIPAVIESVMTGVLDWWTEEDSHSHFHRGQWVSVISGFHKHNRPTSFEGVDLFYEDDGDEDELPIFDVAFYIKTHANKSDCIVFDVKQGKIRTVPLNDVRAIPDQSALNDNEFLRDLKLLYFKEEGPGALVQNLKDIAVGKEVMFGDVLWEVLEMDPVKNLVSIVKDNKLVKTTMDALEIIDGGKLVTQFGKTKNAFPNTVEKFGFAWLIGGSEEQLCCIERIFGDKATIHLCESGEKIDVDSNRLRKISDKFKNTIMNVAEFRRFQGKIIRKGTPVGIWRFRHLCTQSNMSREMDTMVPETVEKEYKFLMQQFQTIDDDVYEKAKELELAYNEAFEVTDGEILPVN